MSIGIYCIRNTVNGKVYIGQSWEIEKRFITHKQGQHNNHLTSAFKKYGIDSFDFSILITVPENDACQEMLDSLEDKYINQFGSMNQLKGYNQRHGGSRGKLTEEAKLKVSKSKKGKNKGINSPLWGVPKTEEAKRKMSLAKKKAYMGDGNPFFGKTHSEEARDKIRKSKVKYKGDNHPWHGRHHSQQTKDLFIAAFGKKVRCIETGVIYPSTMAAGRAVGGSGQNISACIRGRIKSSYGFHWEHVNKDGPNGQ